MSDGSSSRLPVHDTVLVGGRSITIKLLTVGELGDALPRLAELRIRVFRDFPYLYDSTAEYEARYGAAFAASKDAVIVAALDGDRLVGCDTGSGLRADVHRPRHGSAPPAMIRIASFTAARPCCCQNTGAAELCAPSSNTAKTMRASAATTPRHSARLSDRTIIR